MKQKVKDFLKNKYAIFGDIKKKICACCRLDIALDNFYKSKSGIFGVSNECKFCSGFKGYRKRVGLPELTLKEYTDYRESKRKKATKNS